MSSRAVQSKEQDKFEVDRLLFEEPPLIEHQLGHRVVDV